MVYVVVPSELEAELFDRLTAYYADDADVTVIVERRKTDRRKRRDLRERTDAEYRDERQRRVVRDRRRRRATGEFAPLYGE